MNVIDIYIQLINNNKEYYYKDEKSVKSSSK